MQATTSALGLSMPPPVPSTAGPAPNAAGGGGGGGLGSLPAPLSKAVEHKHTADALLQSLAQQSHATATPRQVAESRGGTAAAPTSLPGRARVALEQCIDAAEQCQHATHARLSDDEQARALFCLGWAKARLAQLVQPDALPAQLELALESLSQATRLVTWFPSEPPHLAATPSVTRPTDPNRHQASLDRLALVPAWGAELVAELARAQTILALAKAMSMQEQRGSSKATGGADTVSSGDDDRQLAELIDFACRRNVQALFTPVDPHSAQSDPAGPSAIGAGLNGGGANSTSGDGLDGHEIGGNSSLADASTVLGNARLLRDVLSALLPYTTDPSAWKLRLDWATHIADVQFVSVSLSVNRLVDTASAEATKLQNSHISPRERQEVKRVLEKTARRMAPYEMRQGNVLLWLGRVMLDAVGALYLGRTEEGFQAERRRREQQALAASSGGDNRGMTEEELEEEEDEEDASEVPVPENDLVRETRQVLIRAAALFENAYASILRAPASARRRRLELRVLRRLEATYCDLELLDNASSPEVVELRSQRIERAVLINERLIALGDGVSSGSRSTRNGRGRGASGLNEDEMDESDREQAAEEADEEDRKLAEDDSDDEQERLSRALGRARLS